MLAQHGGDPARAGRAGRARHRRPAAARSRARRAGPAGRRRPGAGPPARVRAASRARPAGPPRPRRRPRSRPRVAASRGRDLLGQLGVEVSGGEVRRLEHAVHEGADLDPGRHRGQRETAASAASALTGRGAARRRRRRPSGSARARLVVDQRVLGFRAHPGLVAGGGDVRVGGPPPAAVETAAKARRLELPGLSAGSPLHGDGHPQRRHRSMRHRPRRPLTQPRSRSATAASAGTSGRRWGRSLPSSSRQNSSRAERGVAAVPGPGPPQHDLVAGPGQGHVGQPQILAALLAQVAARGGAS